jgi:hypothetical protein
MVLRDRPERLAISRNGRPSRKFIRRIMVNMTVVITPEILRAKDAQYVGFRWVSFTRASPPKVDRFWMRASRTMAMQGK